MARLSQTQARRRENTKPWNFRVIMNKSLVYSRVNMLSMAHTIFQEFRNSLSRVLSYSSLKVPTGYIYLSFPGTVYHAPHHRFRRGYCVRRHMRGKRCVPNNLVGPANASRLGRIVLH